MLGILELKNPIRRYPWGSRTAIAELLGRSSPAPEPEAELWLGGHPGAPSEVLVEGRWRSLRELVTEAGGELLGAEVASRYGGELPFLMKVLAAAEPLSIQAHPDAAAAASGFRREEARGIPRDAPERCYRDPRAKPELLYALTPFRMLRGFRPPAEVALLVEELGLAGELPEHGGLRHPGEARALERFVTAYMTLPEARLATLLPAAVERARRGAEKNAIWRCIVELAERYPDDRGVLAPLFLQLVELEPGEAVDTPPGVLHSYLGGIGVELMASSDNVLRGALTGKHVDVGELLAILRYEPQPPRRLRPEVDADGGRRFVGGDGELALTVLELSGEVRCRGGGAALLLCTAGGGVLGSDPGRPFRRGDSFLVPASVGNYRISGTATLFRAELGPSADRGAGADR
jgi:mannose-6-phosphate isomerase